MRDPPILCTKKEIARFCGNISQKTLSRLIEHHGFPIIRIEGQYYTTHREVLKWLTQKMREQAEANNDLEKFSDQCGKQD